MRRQYGAVALDGAEWKISAEPHVMIRAKNVFRSVSRQATTTLAITCTPSVSRDLQWFLDRYPMGMSDADRAELDRQAEVHEQRMALVQQVIAGTAEGRTFDLAIKPRRYQVAAAELALSTGRVLIADGLGLGKTCTAICIMADASARPALVVTMTHLVIQWSREIARFAPKLHVMVPKKGTPTERELEALRGGSLFHPDVLVLNYHKLAGWADAIAKIYQPRAVVFDEAHELRTGPGTNRYAAAQTVTDDAIVKVGLSATPVMNYGGEIYNVLRILDQHALGSKSEFETEWCTGSSGDRKARIKNPDAFGTWARECGLLLRRTGADVKDEVPELARPMHIPHEIDHDDSVVRSGEIAACDLARMLLDETQKALDRGRAEMELDTRMRQAVGIAKAPYVAAFVKMLLEADESDRVVLFGWHHAVYDIWAAALREFDPVRYTGGQSAVEKDAAREAFVKGKSRVLLMSLRAGAGLDGLQGASRIVVFGELDWSWGAMEQCVGRLDRPGQADTVRAYYLHADAGLDPKMMDVLGIKRDQGRRIVDPGSVSDTLSVHVDSKEHVRELARAMLARRA